MRRRGGKITRLTREGREDYAGRWEGHSGGEDHSWRWRWHSVVVMQNLISI